MQASNPANSSLGSNTTFTYTIANNAGGNNDAKPSIQFNTATATGLESATSFDIQLDLSAASGLESTVDYALSGGSPAATGSGTDYTIADGTVALRAGETTANISATVVNDALDENDDNDKPILERLLKTPNLEKQPDVHMHVVVPNEFQALGKYNIGITAGLETTVCPPEWLEGLNRMDFNLSLIHI